MGETQRSAGQRLVHGFFGALLAALIAISILLFTHFHWWVIGVSAAGGFVIGWFFGEEAIEWLKSILWWA